MEKPLSVLLIEDSHRDVSFEVRALETAGYRVTFAVADTAAEMKAALAEEPFDIVLSDIDLPQFNAPGALAVLAEGGLDIPLIIVSGAIGEENAVALIKEGASDYVPKDRLTRLASTVEYALRDSQKRRRLKQAEEALRASEEKYRLLADNTVDGVWLLDMNFKLIYCSPASEKQSGFTVQEIMEMSLEQYFTPASLKVVAEAFLEAVPRTQADPDYNPILNLELEFNKKDGTAFWSECRFRVIRDQYGKPVSILGQARDITERRLAEEKLVISHESLKKTLNDAINTMVKIVEMRDPYTAGHQQKVAELATAIAVEMKLDDTRIDQLRTAAVIHDIGKMYVPSDILSKPGALSQMELDLIETHVQGGYDIIKGMDFPCNVARVVLQHHERLDGSGYPNGLKSEDILLEAKILSVADAVEAMASHRPYRAAMGIDKALEDISRGKGKIYDPGAVDACLELFNSGRFEFKAV